MKSRISSVRQREDVEDRTIYQIDVVTICCPEITDDPVVKNAIQATIDSYHREGRVFPHGQLRYPLNKRAEQLETAERGEIEEEKTTEKEEEDLSGIDECTSIEENGEEGPSNSSQASPKKTVEENSYGKENKEIYVHYGARGRIEEITKAIEGMRASRDEKLQGTQQLQAQQQQLSVQSQEFAHAVLQLQSANKETTARLHEVEQTENAREAAVARVEQLKKEVELAKERTQKQKELVKKKQQEMDLVRPGQDKVRNDYADAVKLLMQLQQQAQQKLAERAEKQRMESLQKQQQNNAFVPAFTEPTPQKVSSPVAEAAQFSRQGSTQHSAPQGSSSGSNPLPTASTAGTARYRAKYEFIAARTEDELSFQEGDVLLVFEGHASEQGWLAGQIREKVGWFPAAFAEPIAPINTNIAQPIQSASEVTPSASLEKIVEEQAEHRSIVTQDHAPVHSSPEVVICTSTAKFPWKARNEGDLSFAKGDTIQACEQIECKSRRTVRWKAPILPTFTVTSCADKQRENTLIVKYLRLHCDELEEDDFTVPQQLPPLANKQDANKLAIRKKVKRLVSAIVDLAVDPNMDSMNTEMATEVTTEVLLKQGLHGLQDTREGLDMGSWIVEMLIGIIKPAVERENPEA